MKLIFDLLFVILFSPLIILLYLIGAFIVFLSDGFPIHFISYRVGIHQKEFRLYKLRTMKVQHDSNKSLITDKNDQRIIKWGRVLRKLKIDEFPQFLNILNRSMSIIGPRPEIKDFIKFYNEDQKKTLNVLPGLACLGSLYYFLFQIEEGNSQYIEKQLPIKLNLDLYYIKMYKKYSILYDFYLIVVTFFFIIIRILNFDKKNIIASLFFKNKHSF